MKLAGFLVTAISFGAAGFAAGAFHGFKDGVHNYAAMEDILQGALAKQQLDYIAQGDIDKVRQSLEINIDAAIHRYAVYQEQGNSYLSSHFMLRTTQELDRYFAEMAEYRKTHPIVFTPDWADAVEGDDEDTALWREQRRAESVEMLAIIKRALDDYNASAPPQ